MKFLKYVKFEYILIMSILLILTLVLYWFKGNEKIVSTILVTLNNSIVFCISKFFETKNKRDTPLESTRQELENSNK